MRRTLISTRTAWLCVLVAVLVCCLLLTFALSVPKQAAAYATDPSATVGEIFNDNATTGGSFDRDNLQKLLNALSGGDNTAVTELQSAVDNSSTVVGAVDSTKTYNDTMQIADKEIIVEFGGIKWLATFLSLTNDGKKDVVLTLWQAEVTNTTDNQVTWSDTVSDFGSKAQNTDFSYPANMYGTSKIRSVTLNNGGSYTTNGTNLQPYSQTNTSKYAKFNMSTYMDGSTQKSTNIYKYLVAPRYLDWQKEQVIPSGWGWAEQGKALNNQAWGIMGKSSFNNASKYPYYEEKTNYAQWADDLIWIPSCAEVGNEYEGNENSGIWLTSKTQRSASDIVWLRTAQATNYYTARALTADGVGYHYATAESYFVRPALHLNLTAATKEVDKDVDKPTVEKTKTVIYNGQQQTLDLGEYFSLVDSTNKKVDISFTQNDGDAGSVDYSSDTAVLTATKAGTYKVSVKPADGYHWKNDDNPNDTEAIEFTLKIEKREVTLDVAIPQGSPTSITYGTRYTLLAASNYWSYASGSLQFVNGDESNLTVSCDAANAGAYATPSTYPLTVNFVGDDSNYKLTINNGNAAVEVTNATLDLSDVSFAETYTYELDENSQGVKREMTINVSSVIAQGGQQVTVTYDKDSFTATSSGYLWDDKIYSVWKAGTYTVQVTVSALYHDSVTRTLTVTINKATAVVKPMYDNSEITTSGSLPAITANATLNGRNVEGTISWTTTLGSVQNTGRNAFGWQWIPENDSIEIAEGVEYLNVTVVGVSKITIEFDCGDRIFYNTDELNDLKNYLTVTIIFQDGTEKVLGMNEYTLSCQGGSSLVAGENVGITVSYLSAGSPVTQSFRINVVETEKPVDPDPVDPDPAPVDPDPEPEHKFSLMEWFENTPLPLGYAAITLGVMLILIIILAIAARKPKRN